MQTQENVFWGLIEENRVSLWRFAFGLTGTDDDAKDLVSDTVLAAHNSFPKLKNIEGFRKSLYTIARRIHLRKTWRKRIFKPLEAGIHIEAETKNESSHDISLLLHALHSLPHKQREAVMLFEISGLSLEEIRAIQGGSLSGVKSRVTRGREAIQQMMSDRSKVILTPSEQSLSDSLVPSIML
jgi:RNA polymerase sigma-70 factor (ECF subfamily)